MKAGTYNEYVSIPKEVQYITMYGDGINQTIVSGDRNVGDNVKTILPNDLKDTATFRKFISTGTYFILTTKNKIHRCRRNGLFRQVLFQK